MKKITKIMLSGDNDLLNDNEMKRIYGGYSTEDSKGYNCTCKVVDSASVILEQKEDVICKAQNIDCCTALDTKYNQVACFEIK